MGKYCDYIIVHAPHGDELSEQVKQYLKEGWILLGAPFSHVPENGTELCQALIKPDAARPGSIGFIR